MSVLWYYRREGVIVGPLRFDALLPLVRSGVIRPNDEVRHGHGDWQTTLDVEELRECLKGSVAVSGDAEQSASPNGEDASLFSSILQSAPRVEGNYSPLDRVGAWDNGTVRDGNEPPEPRYFLRIDRDELGPLSLDLLQQRVNEGRLSKLDRCRAENSLCWIPVREIAELAFPPSSDSEMPLPKTESRPGPVPTPATAATVSDSTRPTIAETHSNSKPPSVLRRPDSHQTTIPAPPTNLNGSAARHADPVPPQLSPPNPPPTPSTVSSEPLPVRQPLPTLNNVAPLPSMAQPRSNPVIRHHRESATRRSFKPTFSLQNPPLVLALAGLVAVLVIVAMLPRGTGVLRGKVLVNKIPLPVGSVSFSPQTGTKGNPLTIPVVSGIFQASSETKLASGDYAIVVTVGNPLGMPLKELDGSPVFSGLSGAKFNTTASTKTNRGTSFAFQFSSGDAVLLKKEGPSINELK